MRILLIATNRHRRLMSRMNAQPVPIGLAYIAGHLDPERHQLKILDLMFSEDYLADTEQAVKEFQPELVGVSLRNLDNSSYMDPQWALPTTKEVIDKVRSVTKAPIVCGGPAFSLLPKECFDYLEPDLGIAGDGGETFAQLAECIESGETYRNLPGMVYREGGAVASNGPAYSNFAKPPRLDELDMARYEQSGFGIGIVTKLDDTFSHSMAANSDGNTWRVLRPIEDVVAEIQEMKDRFGLRKVFFIDSGFNMPLPHAKALCQSIIESDLKIHWNSYLAPVPAACDEEVLGLMKQAGSGLVIMKGVAGHDLEQESLQAKMEPLRDVCQRCDDADIHYVISQFFGEPGETRETVEAKLDFLREIRPSLANLRVGVRIRPGSDVARAALKEGMIADESDLIRPTFYLAESVREWIVERLTAEAAANPRWNVL
ncbi:MAG: cobalamin-dependent protein [Chloroflexi bacterium]|nr:cobalamin-dependent protein [Chloroflexota bacterium]MDA1219032.1 cobalamin-dependent protein [Chloroflexota bacterium]